MKLFRSLIILILFASNVSGQERKETLKVNLPEQYNWKTEADKQDSTIHTIVMKSENEDAQKGGLKVFLKKNDGELFVAMEIAMNGIANLARQKSAKSTVKLIERDKDEKNHWIIFKIESATAHSDKGLESRLYYIIQGNSGLYTNYVAVPGKSLSDELVSQWSSIFKNSILEYDAPVTDKLRL